jgi:flagellar FliJ protein
MPYTVKRFRFRLQSLLHIEQSRERQAQIAFQKALGDLRRQQETLARQEEEFRIEQEGMAAAIRRGTSPQELFAYEQFFTGLKARMDAQRALIAQAEQAVETARKELVERTKKRKILERLKEKAKEQHSEESRHVEIAVLDEVGTSMTFQKLRT